MTRHIGLLQILFLVLCLLSTDCENTTNQFAKVHDFWSVWYGDRVSFRYSFIRIQFQINYHSLGKYANVIHRQVATNYNQYNVQG